MMVVTPPHCGAVAQSGEVLFVGQPGVPGVDVGVHAAGQDEHGLGIDGPGGIQLRVWGRQGVDLPIQDADV